MFSDDRLDIDRLTISPKPWRVNPDWGKEGGHAVTPPPILDANGEGVFDTSEWISVARVDIELIVAAVNAYAD